MDVFLPKEELGKELGISLATVNNWIKTQVIPLPDHHNCYSGETFNFILNSIKNSPTRLNSRANRKQSEKTALSFSGTSDKKRKELLSGLVRRFYNSGFTFDEGVLALSFSLLCSAGLINRNWKFNDGSILDKFLSNWLKEARDYELVKNLFFDFEIENKDDEYFIDFKPELYQQTAPSEYYRQKKIVYKFINDSIICVLDTNSSLILNSANLFISSDYPMETIVSLFNSAIYTFSFRKKFNSRKVLKSHLQDLPLPLFDGKTHKHIFNLYSGSIAKRRGTIDAYQKIIDKIICDYFLISKQEYQHIFETL